jgi:FixJ family two-component response regulator
MSSVHSGAPTVFVVDDDEALRDALSQLLDSSGIKVECHADGTSFLSDYREDRPGCLLLDIAMPGMSGLDVQSELRARGHRIPIIFLTGHGDIPMAVKATREGALDFLEKPFRPDHLLDRVRQCLQTDQENREADDEARSARERYKRLSPRERQVMTLVASGFTNKEIAQELGLSPRTVEVHRTHVMHKMGAASLAELVGMAALCST